MSRDRPVSSLRRLSSRALRDAFNAPELERYLNVRRLDLAVTDQPQAVRVRIESGIAVLEGRVLVAYVAGWRRQGWLAALLGLFLGAFSGSLWAWQTTGPFLSAPLAAAALAGAAACARAWRRLRRDLQVLRRLRGRYRSRTAICEGMDELVRLSREIHDDVVLVGGGFDTPPSGGPYAPADPRRE